MANEYKFENLEKIRKAYGLSVDELMEKVGKKNSRSTYYKWQKTGQIKACDIIKLHKIFNVSTDLLLDVKPFVIEN